MGKSQRDKGYRGENALRIMLKDSGIKCRRVPLSGACEGAKGDLLLGKNEERMEVKLRGQGFKTLYNWLKNNRFLAVKADHKPYLIVMELKDFVKLYKDD